MISTIKANTPSQNCPASPVIVGPWPSYVSFAALPERERWLMYSGAKAHREMLEQAGFVMAESYDDFVRRVTRELNV